MIGAVVMLLSGCAGPVNPTDPTPEAGIRAALTVDLNSTRQISDTLFGLFLEDINFAVDAGLYAELIKNRSFEYGALAANGAKHGWAVTDPSVTFETASDAPLNENNPTYAILTHSADTPEGICNSGYLDGLAVEAGQRYTASLFVRGSAGLQLSLEGSDGTVYAAAQLTAQADDWTKYTVTLTPTDTVSRNLRFAVRIDAGTVQLDMVSLMPEDTYQGLPIRKDLGEYLEALNPSFLRFPGGCVIEGKSLESMYSWKDSIGNGIPFTVNGESAVGDPATRPQVVDIWSGSSQDPYYCTYGLGFYEYFLLCEALDCLPVPIVNAGMTCQVQSPQYIVFPTDSPEFQQCIQDALDLVEFCRGGADTEWGAVRIAMGHEEPFDLKYIGIGNEQWQTEYHEHYELFADAFYRASIRNPKLYGDIELIVANGPASDSTEGWQYVQNHSDSFTTLVDEHYYQTPTWFLNNTKRYDSYDRTLGAKVFLGEYAAQSNNMNAALAEAAYMTALERNGDVVEMACYAPLFGNAKLNQWLPDMIFFSNDSVYGTPNYYVQKLFGNNAGTAYLQTDLTLSGKLEEGVFGGKVGLGSWQTSVAYDNLKVVSNADGSVLYENGFDTMDGLSVQTGSWEIRDGQLVQTNTAAPVNTNIGDALYLGDSGWSDYTMTVDATVLGGAEGFLIPICVENTNNNIFWNVGGWGNTVSCLQIVADGTKSGQISGTVRNLKLLHDQVYQLKVTVSGNSIKCYLNDTLFVDYTQETAEPVYASTVRAENGDLILKVVNVSGERIPVTLNIPGLSPSTATVSTLAAAAGSATNSFGQPENVFPTESTMEISDGCVYEAPPYSLTVIRIPGN